MLQKILTLVKLSVKAGVCGGALYITKEQGVWGDVKQGEAAYYRLKNLTLKAGMWHHFDLSADFSQTFLTS